MHKLEVLIEENSFGSVRPVAVVADAPVGAIVPALVQELNLPQTDLFGKPLVYMLRQSSDGRILPESTTLHSSGIKSGACLALDSFVMDGSVAALARQQQTKGDADLYSATTIADADAFFNPVGAVASASGDQSALAQPDQASNIGKRKRRGTRRAFLLLAGGIVGASGLGAAYAAYRTYIQPATNNQAPGTNGTAPVKQTPSPTSANQNPAALPTRVQMALNFTVHQQTVRTVVWSSTGNLLASGGDDAQVFLWNTQGNIQKALPHQGSVLALAFSPDGQALVSAANTQMTFFNAQSGAVLSQDNQQHAQTITSLAWSAQQLGQVVSGGMDKRAVIWDGTNYQPQLTYHNHTNSIDAVSWSADGQAVASASQGGAVRVWNPTNGQDLHGYFQDGQLPQQALAFAPNSMQLAAGGNDGQLRFWNGLTCKNMNNAQMLCNDAPQRLGIAQKAIRSLAWSPDGRLLAVGAEDGLTRILAPAQSQQPLLTIKQTGIVHSLAWSPTNRQLATVTGKAVTIWTLM